MQHTWAHPSFNWVDDIFSCWGQINTTTESMHLHLVAARWGPISTGTYVLLPCSSGASDCWHGIQNICPVPMTDVKLAFIISTNPPSFSAIENILSMGNNTGAQMLSTLINEQKDTTHWSRPEGRDHYLTFFSLDPWNVFKFKPFQPLLSYQCQMVSFDSSCCNDTKIL